MKFVLMASVAAGVLVGCGGAPEFKDLETEYAEQVQAVGILPIYPPREDFTLGDIYLASVSRRSAADLEYVWAGHIDGVPHAVQEALNRQLVFKDTEPLSTERQTGDTKTFQADLLENGKLSTREGKMSDISSLPVVAFPSIEGSAAFAAGTGLTALQTAFNLGGRRDSRVRLDFVGVRSLGMPPVEASTFNNKMLATALPRLPVAVEALQREVVLGGRGIPGSDKFQAAGGPSRCVSLTLITQLYLTREIDYTFIDTRSFGAGLRQGRREKGDLASVGAAPVPVNVFGTDGDGRITLTQEDLAKLQEGFSGAPGTSPGRAAAIQSANGEQVTFKRRFQRPVVVGWDGYDLNIPKRITKAAEEWDKDRNFKTTRAVFETIANILHKDVFPTLSDQNDKTALAHTINAFREDFDDDGYAIGFDQNHLRALANVCDFDVFVGE
ncbi:MAG: hypothetical protein AAGA78_02535 [Pseudomonadota bacterium]